MALSAAAVSTAAQVAFLLAGKVIDSLRAVFQAHLKRQRELQLLVQLQGKLHDRCWKKYPSSQVMRIRERHQVSISRQCSYI